MNDVSSTFIKLFSANCISIARHREQFVSQLDLFLDVCAFTTVVKPLFNDLVVAARVEAHVDIFSSVISVGAAQLVGARGWKSGRREFESRSPCM